VLQFSEQMKHSQQSESKTKASTWTSKPRSRSRTWNTRQGQDQLAPRPFVAKAMASRTLSLHDYDDDDDDVCRSRSTKHWLHRAVEVWRSSHQTVDCRWCSRVRWQCQHGLPVTHTGNDDVFTYLLFHQYQFDGDKTMNIFHKRLASPSVNCQCFALLCSV